MIHSRFNLRHASHFWRLQQKHRDADDLATMQARTLVYRAMVLSPIVFIGTLAGQARLSHDSYVPLGCSEFQQQAITRYREAVAKVDPLRRTSLSKQKPENVRAIAHFWLKGAREGTLQPLTPSFYGDSLRDGVKFQIKQASDEIVTRLAFIAYKEARSKSYSQSAQDLVSAIRIIEILKYSDPFSVAVGGLRERGFLSRIAELSPKLSENERAQVRKQIVALKADQQPLDQVVLRVRNLYALDQTRKGDKPLDIQEPTDFVTLKSSPNPTSEAILAVLKNSKVASNAPESLPFVPELKMAWSSQQKILKDLDQTISALQPAIKTGS